MKKLAPVRGDDRSMRRWLETREKPGGGVERPPYPQTSKQASKQARKTTSTPGWDWEQDGNLFNGSRATYLTYGQDMI
jgi:hypothetical protein